jgi:tetratricopeptide (TPR) repeat protein
MKAVLIKTCFWTLAHLFVQRDTPYKKAVNLYTNKHYKESVAICNAELKKTNVRDTMYEQYLLLRSGNHYQMHDTQGGLKDYQQLIKIKPKEIPYYVNLANIYDALTQYQDCMATLQKAYRIDSTNMVLLSNLSYYSGMYLKYRDAIDYADKGLQYKPDSNLMSSLHNNKGYGLIGLKKYTEAMDNVNIALQYDPKNAYAYTYRALINIRTGKMATVCDDLSKSMDLGGMSMTPNLIGKYCADKKQ